MNPPMWAKYATPPCPTAVMLPTPPISWTANQIKDHAAGRAEIIRFQFVAEYPQIEHVAGDMQDVGVQEHGREQGLQMHPMHNFRRFHRIPRYETVPQAQLSEEDKDVRHDKRDEGDRKPAERARLVPFRD